MKKPLWIFGDSYVDSQFPNDSNEYLRWWQYLEKEYIIFNFGLTGTGPKYALSTLYKAVQWQKNTKDVSILFVISDPERVSFKELPPARQHQLKNDVIVKSLSPGEQRKLNEIKNYYNWMVINYFDNDEYKLELITILNSLYVLQENFDKIMVLQAFGHPEINQSLKPGLSLNIDYIKKETDKWKFITLPLSLLSIEYCKDMNEDVYTKVDHRLNHFGAHSSKRIGTEILKWFKYHAFSEKNITTLKNKFEYPNIAYWNYNE
jgi:hypothetical protein